MKKKKGAAKIAGIKKGSPLPPIIDSLKREKKKGTGRHKDVHHRLEEGPDRAAENLPQG